MTTLLISMLGDAPAGGDRPGHDPGPFRLPGGERIVETPHLGIELARAIQAQSLVFVGTTTAYFDQLVQVLPESARQAPVEERTKRKRGKGASADEGSDAQAAADEDLDEDSDSEDSDADSAPEAEMAAEDDADTAEAPAAAAADGAPESAPAEEAAPAAESAPAPQATEGDSAPQESATDAPSEDAAPPASDAVADAPLQVDPAPATEASEGATDAVIATPAATSDEPAPAAAALPREEVVKKHEADLRPLEERIQAQVTTGLPDRDALRALGDRLRDHLAGTPGSKLKSVRCQLISDGLESRSLQSGLLTLAELPRQGERVVLDTTHATGALPMLAILASQYLSLFRRDLKETTVLQGDLSHRDSSGIVALQDLGGVREIFHWMDVFKDLADGGAPSAVQEIFNQDRRLQRLNGPYVRYQRGVRFGALSEVVRGAEMLEEKRKRLGRLHHSHPYRLFDRVLRDTMKPILGDAKASVKQLELARSALRVGQLPQTALHLREALISACLEAFGRDPTQSWMEVPQSGGAQMVRPREVASYVLSTPAAVAKAQDLATIWPLLSTARNRYVNTTATNVPASQLKDEEHEVHRLIDMAVGIIEESRLDGIGEDLDFVEAVKQGIDLRALRPRESRRGQGGGGGRNDGRRRDGGGRGGDRGGDRGDQRRREPRGDRPPRGGDRPPRGERPQRNRRGPGGGEGGPPRGRRDEGGGRPPQGDAPGGESGEAKPRVGRKSGFGNVGIALAAAGIVDEPQGKKKRKGGKGRNSPREAGAGEGNAPPEPGAAAGNPGAGVDTPPPAPETRSDAAPPAAAPETPPTSFDVAGPGAPPPAE